MHFIYILDLGPQYKVKTNWNEETAKIMGEHWNYLVALHEKGVMKLVGRTDYEVENPDIMGIAVFEAETAEKANEIMLNDPCVKKGVMTAKVHPFRLSLYGEPTDAGNKQ